MDTRAVADRTRPDPVSAFTDHPPIVGPRYTEHGACCGQCGTWLPRLAFDASVTMGYYPCGTFAGQTIYRTTRPLLILCPTCTATYAHAKHTPGPIGHLSPPVL